MERERERKRRERERERGERDRDRDRDIYIYRERKRWRERVRDVENGCFIFIFNRRALAPFSYLFLYNVPVNGGVILLVFKCIFFKRERTFSTFKSSILSFIRGCS